MVVEQLAALDARIGRDAVRQARGRRDLLENLTDRELAILRALRGPLSAREIGNELHLSINTVKGYTKSLYRKLGVVTRVQAVHRGTRSRPDLTAAGRSTPGGSGPGVVRDHPPEPDSPPSSPHPMRAKERSIMTEPGARTEPAVPPTLPGHRGRAAERGRRLEPYGPSSARR